jgi:hypothetical protein
METDHGQESEGEMDGTSYKCCECDDFATTDFAELTRHLTTQHAMQDEGDDKVSLGDVFDSEQLSKPILEPKLALKPVPQVQPEPELELRIADSVDSDSKQTVVQNDILDVKPAAACSPVSYETSPKQLEREICKAVDSSTAAPESSLEQESSLTSPQKRSSATTPKKRSKQSLLRKASLTPFKTSVKWPKRHKCRNCGFAATSKFRLNSHERECKKEGDRRKIGTMTGMAEGTGTPTRPKTESTTEVTTESATQSATGTATETEAASGTATGNGSAPSNESNDIKSGKRLKHKCDLCSFTTYSRVKLKCHGRAASHHPKGGMNAGAAPEKALVCDACAYKCRSGTALKMHKIKMHPECRDE